ncbi:MAG: D-Ala-D-Ala carboxypeptidase family metallohydrolase [Paludibacteraceae bacterium]|nr:D-Ala-D-Ala carboxypeptidase family metallohydrolase [Paludibacteraceae bacterium]
MKDIQLSEHFKLSEFTKSATADKLGIKNEPTDTEIGHLRLLCTYILEPLRQAWDDGITITSGFRCEKLNKGVGGSKTSAHRLGYAADIVPANGQMVAFKYFVKQSLKDSTYFDFFFDQCIDEKKGASEWVHLGLMNAQGEQRRQFLITKDGKTYKEDKV